MVPDCPFDIRAYKGRYLFAIDLGRCLASNPGEGQCDAILEFPRVSPHQMTLFKADFLPVRVIC
jgi:hypothetical protein